MSEQDGVLGRLPRTRPSVASPRRAAARDSAAKAAERQKPAKGERDPVPEAKPAEPAGQASGFEELARAGAGLATVTVVAGAHLTGRILGEMAKAVGRR